MYFGTLPEEFIFISLDDETGSFHLSDLFLSIGLGGASLLSLTVKGRLSVKKEELVVIDETSIKESNVLNDIFDYIKQKETVKNTHYWIRNIRNEFPNLVELYINEMIENGKLERYTQKKFFVFKETKYKSTNEEVKEIIKNRLNEAIVGNKETDARTIALISLLYATNSAREIMDEKELETYMEQIRNFEEEIGVAVEESIDTIMDALMRSLIVNSQYPYL